MADLYDALVQYLRAPSVRWDQAGGPTYAFTPPLTPAEQVIFDRIKKIVKSAVLITPAEWEAIESDIAGLQTYQSLPTPTLAQTVQAVKAQSRILRALLRD